MTKIAAALRTKVEQNASSSIIISLLSRFEETERFIREAKTIDQLQDANAMVSEREYAAKSAIWNAHKFFPTNTEAFRKAFFQIMDEIVELYCSRLNAFEAQ